MDGDGMGWRRRVDNGIDINAFEMFYYRKFSYLYVHSLFSLLLHRAVF